MKYTLKIAQGDAVNMLAIEANDALQACAMAEAEGHHVLSIKSDKGSALNFRLSHFTHPKFNVMLFSQELLALIESGLSLIESIEALAEKEMQTDSKAVLTQIKTALLEGQPLSNALEKISHVFSALYVALIRASERTGDMEKALSRHVAYQMQVDAMKKKIISASIYPLLLVVVGGLVVLFLLGYVVPKFSVIYESTNADLPWMSQILLSWGRLLHDHGRETFAVFIGVGSLLIYGITRPIVRSSIMAKVWTIPALGETMRIYQLARFYRTLSMLLRGGVPLITAMNMVSSLLQPLLRSKLAAVVSDVKEGKHLSAAMEQYGMTTSISVRMLRVGERTGQMGEMMERIGAFYDDEIARAVEWFTKLLEPVLMIVIGLIVGLVVVLMYMPIFELAGSIQ